MPINSPAAAASSSSSHRRRLGHGSSHPSWILLNNTAYTGSRPNNSTAVCEGRNNLTIEASFWPAPPPRSSDVFVHCPIDTFGRTARILCMAADLLLFRVPVAVRPPPCFLGFEDCDYFIYQAGGTPSLTWIPNPEPIHDRFFGLLPRAGDLFTIAALVANTTENEYTLHRFDSEVGNWTLKTVSLEAPRKPYPVKIPKHASVLNHHITTTVISIGGEAGTMGWVDLWSGILLYDLFPKDQERPVLRHIPLPLPADLKTKELGYPGLSRGIASVIKHGEPCLKLAGRQMIEVRLHHKDIETKMPCYMVDNWAITTWSNLKFGYSDSFEDWHEDFTVWASEIIISDAVHSKLLASGLLHRKPSEDDGETVEVGLQNLAVTEPTPSLNGEEEVVYLIARSKHFHPKTWALSIDVKNRTLLDVSEFCTDDTLGLTQYATYRSSTISKCMTPPGPPEL